MNKINTDRIPSWNRFPGNSCDRLFFIHIRYGFPLQDYVEVKQIENQYYYYEKNDFLDVSGISVNKLISAWKSLPSVSAPSDFEGNIPETLKSKRDAVKQLFDKAVDYGIIKINKPFDYNMENDFSFIFGISNNIQKEIDELPDVLNMLLHDSNAEKIEALNTRIKELISCGYKELTITNYKLKQHPCRTDNDDYDAIMKFDYLYLSPIYQDIVRNIIDQLDRNLRILQGADRKIKEYFDQV